jgi:diguanylate cyclase (GGDEF)-like protein
VTGWPEHADAADELAPLVRAWATAVHRARFVPMSRAERSQLLHGLAAQLATALRAEPFDPAVGHRVGAALVAAHYNAPEVLARTVTVLHSRLLPGLGLTGEAAADRLTALVEAVTVGFTRALRDGTLDAQEEIRVAATMARAEAERALRESEARFRHAALHDPLTGLPNQTMFMGRLRQVLADPPAGARLGVCCIDLDRFEAINDSLGPPVGDRLLIAVADRLRELVADWGHLLVRRNSDQFAILVERTTSAEDVTKVADRVLSALTAPFRIDAHELSISASAGVVERPAAGASPTELVRAADVALHWAKADGRGRWMLFEERRSNRDVARYRLSAEMPRAMRRGEFGLAYQPLVDLRTHQIVGVEALARWYHPRYGVLGADWFVSQAEDTGLIVPLGTRLLTEACRQGQRWRDELGGRAPYVSVNLSARQLRQPGLVAEILEVLDRTGLPPDQLQLEITESALVVDDRPTLGSLEELAAHGVRIVIDDFGTGYSNFAYLYDLPVHGIKLAGQLLRDVGRRSGSDGSTHRPRVARPAVPRPRRSEAQASPGLAGHAILTSLISLGRILGLTVTAKRVQTATQAQWLRALGCHVGQGWHFGWPGYADQLGRLLARQQPGPL